LLLQPEVGNLYMTHQSKYRYYKSLSSPTTSSYFSMSQAPRINSSTTQKY